MLPKLLESEKFKKELITFQQDISKIQNEKLKEKLSNDINRLKEIAKEIDVGHDTRFNGMIHPSRLSEARENLSKLRYSIKKNIEQAIKLQGKT